MNSPAKQQSYLQQQSKARAPPCDIPTPFAFENQTSKEKVEEEYNSSDKESQQQHCIERQQKAFVLCQQQLVKYPNFAQEPVPLQGPLQASMPNQQIQNPSSIMVQPLNSQQQTQQLSSFLWKMSLEGLFGWQSIEFLQRFFIKEFIKIDQQGKLKDHQRQFASKFMNPSLQPYPKNFIQSSSPIKQQIKLQYYQRQYLINGQQNQNELKLKEQNSSSIRLKSNTKKHSFSQQRKMKQFRSQKSHRIFSQFLNTSMKKLHLYKVVKFFCISIKAWTTKKDSGHSVTSFLRKLIAIKIFYPNSFAAIIKQFIGLIEELNKIEKANEIDQYAKEILSIRYLNCVKIYVYSDNILEAANQLYKMPKRRNYSSKLHQFEDYQRQMKQKAHQLNLQKNGNSLSINQIKRSLKYIQETNKQMKNINSQMAITKNKKFLKEEQSPSYFQNQYNQNKQDFTKNDINYEEEDQSKKWLIKQNLIKLCYNKSKCD